MNRKGYILFHTLLFLLVGFNIRAEINAPIDSLTSHSRLKKGLLITFTSGATIGSLTYLNTVWYNQFKTSTFHFFSDNNEWLQMDKCGHLWTNYNTCRSLYSAAKWAGFSSKKSVFLSEAYSTLYMTGIEIMDGFSSGWGFSCGDELSNIAGSAFFLTQNYFWKDQRILIKFSFHTTSFPQYRPEVLGENTGEQIIKDYNGQSYWLSTNIASFLKKETIFPKWLNLAVGYGAEDMISGNNNYSIINTNGMVIGMNRYRKLFLSLDIDLTKVKTKSHFLKGVFMVLNSFKIPFPSLEFNHTGIKGHIFYF